MLQHKVIVIGGTGNVGRNVLQMLIDSKLFDISNIRATGSIRSAGSYLTLGEHRFFIENTEGIKFQKNELCIFNTEADVSSKYIPIALESGAYVIDSSSHYRMDDAVPLIIPNVNIDSIDITKSKLFAHANCIAAPIATVIAPLHKKFGVRRAIVSTYQSTSGAGKKAMDECLESTRDFCNNSASQCHTAFPRPIVFNIIPQIGGFYDNGFCSEETKISNEIQKVVSKDIFISATSVRVPVLIGHSSSLSMKLGSKCNANDILNTLVRSSGIKISPNQYHTPIEVVGSDDVFVGRLRVDGDTHDQWIHMWVCSDNLRVGAATDSFQITKAIAGQM
jgi:aspartate-semialdehyde dehydrogenase